MIAVVGWSGAASLMRDAARRIDWSLRRGNDMPGITLPLSREDIAIELLRLGRSEGQLDDYNRHVFRVAAHYLREKPESDPNEYEAKSFEICLTNARNNIGCVMKDGVTEHAKSALHDAIKHLRAAIKKLDG